ncbi:hypothetical protein NPX13_g2582 [Xylaria arbuscula]|uniref:F-box domain-containing protein n=1 Tax=Xylaria arbuscula TaxID=114810 RepID=A0A9W8NIX7_9PEZI|nr:hypothetical protein NPX13_g2582 [Xylaria arbuscula]
MPQFVDLPCEMVVAIFKHLDYVNDLFSCMTTCRYFYRCSKAYRNLGLEMVVKHVGYLLPFAIAAEAVSDSPQPCSRAMALKMFQCLQDDPGALVNRLYHYPLESLAYLQEMHDRMEIFANLIFRGICDHITRGVNTRGLPNLSSPAVFAQQKKHFCRAFYRLELYVRLFEKTNPRRDPGKEMFFFGTESRDQIKLWSAVVETGIEFNRDNFGDEGFLSELPATVIDDLKFSWNFDAPHLQRSLNIGYYNSRPRMV